VRQSQNVTQRIPLVGSRTGQARQSRPPHDIRPPPGTSVARPATPSRAGLVSQPLGPPSRIAPTPRPHQPPACAAQVAPSSAGRTGTRRLSWRSLRLATVRAITGKVSCDGHRSGNRHRHAQRQHPSVHGSPQRLIPPSGRSVDRAGGAAPWPNERTARCADAAAHRCVAPVPGGSDILTAHLSSPPRPYPPPPPAPLMFGATAATVYPIARIRRTKNGNRPRIRLYRSLEQLLVRFTSLPRANGCSGADNVRPVQGLRSVRDRRLRARPGDAAGRPDRSSASLTVTCRLIGDTEPDVAWVCYEWSRRNPQLLSRGADV